MMMQCHALCDAIKMKMMVQSTSIANPFVSLENVCAKQCKLCALVRCLEWNGRVNGKIFLLQLFDGWMDGTISQCLA